MTLRIQDAELFGVTESSLTLFFRVEDDAGPVDAEARIRLNGETRAVSEGGGVTRSVRIEGLQPATRYEIAIEVEGATPPQPDVYYPGHATTHPAPQARAVGTFATMNDLHFGEPRFGGILTEDFEYAGESDEFPAVHETDSEVPYWRAMNQDAVAEINASGADLAIIKGDIADRGRPEQFEAAAKCFASFRMPHEAFLGNHDYYGLHDDLEVDGYALLGQAPAPRTIDFGGWRLVLLDTVEPGEHHGVLGDERLRWLAEVLEETRELGTPSLIFTHHQPVPPQHASKFPNNIGIRPEHSLRLYDLLGGHPQVQGVLIGHTHRNRVRRHRSSGPLAYAEVNCVKDYPGGWAHYRLYDDGSFRQEVRRTSSERALAHSSRCRHFFRGLYRDFALGPLEARSFVEGGRLG